MTAILESNISLLDKIHNNSVQDVGYTNFFGINEEELVKICASKDFPLEQESTFDFTIN